MSLSVPFLMQRGFHQKPVLRQPPVGPAQRASGQVPYGWGQAGKDPEQAGKGWGMSRAGPKGVGPLAAAVTVIWTSVAWWTTHLSGSVRCAGHALQLSHM